MGNLKATFNGTFEGHVSGRLRVAHELTVKWRIFAICFSLVEGENEIYNLVNIDRHRLYLFV